MYRNIDEINQALGMTGSNYRVPGPGPTQAERGAQNQAEAMRKVGAVANLFMGNYAGAASALQSQQKDAAAVKKYPGMAGGGYADPSIADGSAAAVGKYPGMAGGGYADPSIAAGGAQKAGGGFDVKGMFGKLFGGFGG